MKVFQCRSFGAGVSISGQVLFIYDGMYKINPPLKNIFQNNVRCFHFLKLTNRMCLNDAISELYNISKHYKITTSVSIVANNIC